MYARTNPKGRIPDALKLIKERLRDPDLSPSKVAGESGLDLPVFCRAFKQVTGMTCTDYISLERIRAAKQLLSRRDLLIKQIAYQVGFEKTRKKLVNKPKAGHFAKANVEPTRYLKEIKFDNAELEVGAEIKVDIFNVGERVDVTGVSRGLGFAGTMKRHGFSVSQMSYI